MIGAFGRHVHAHTPRPSLIDESAALLALGFVALLSHRSIYGSDVSDDL
jgi:hypothetical protein